MSTENDRYIMARHVLKLTLIIKTLIENVIEIK